MAADNQAQSSAIAEISATIGTMDQSTQQNAAMVEETSAAARNLASEVGRLAEQAQRFRIVDAAAGRGAMYRAAPTTRAHGICPTPPANGGTARRPPPPPMPIG